ncbi:MAG: galactokinase, partial [Lachnospiraceae bacterium]|nr:galactokinase [Lachnospiraceae bacterium]
MKITDIETIEVGKYLFVKVYTDAGIYGIGEAGAWGYLDGVSGVLKKLAGYLKDKDPFQIEHHWNAIYRSMYFRGSILMSALSAIDIALWDIKGKALGVPIYELLGGKCRDKVRCYEAVFQFTPESMAQACLDLKNRGCDAARLMITGDLRQSQADRTSSIYN